ncbi:MAG: Amidase [Candidatus Uhrbacteria bacterium GW2011_GWA2_52_8d]|uniref:Amidase n=1 Tax=Candidatus Uhrbacteria bacterium GW2011_GWA2_52_8d TaxID=1618979 RepID=A0A0G2AFW6_9BACT|nr:MAG: Amidase [Candidatus Uhrbacteria bacterium GW2011_GWA2_52_8d]
MKRLFVALGFFFLPVAAHAASDLSISPADIRFSSDILVAGDEVRLYAKVYNVGDEDVSGYVSFYQGATLIDDSLVISLLADGSPEEVYIDFVVPVSSFNILALLRGTDPSDINSSNDSALTSTFIPVVDNDRDGIDNEDDNCPDASNNNQLNTDGDEQGDACDSDDDNDGLSDEVEAELQTNSTQQDSDGDGVTDPDDAYPMDAERTVVEVETESVSEEKAVPSSEAFQKIVEEVAKTIKETVTASEDESVDADFGASETSETEEAETVDEELHISPNAVFAYTRDAWNAFTFTVLTNASEQTVYIWDFGDGVTSSKPTVRHVYNTSGAFLVKLTMTDESGVVSSESTTILVPFFHLQNRLVLTSIALLILLLLAGVASFIRLGKKSS